MKIIIKRDEFFKSLHAVEGSADKKGTYPILSYAKLSVKDGSYNLSTTNLNHESSINGKCESIVVGECAVPVALLVDILKNTPSDTELSIEVQSCNEDGGVMKIQFGKSKFSLNILSSSEFPEIVCDEFKYELKVKSEVILRAINLSKDSICKDESRFNINGLLIHTAKNESGENYINVVTTDSHRLTLVKIKAADDISIPHSIIPKKSLSQFESILKNAKDEEILMSFSDKKLRIKTNDSEFITKLVDSTFPDYARVIPKNNDKKLIINRSDLSAALGRISVVHRNEIVKGVKITISNDKMTLHCTNSLNDSIEEEVDVQYSGDLFEASYNPSYISETIAVLQSSTGLEISLGSSSSPISIVGDKDDNALYIVMPMKSY
jgi:DNA polymerase-3 subunit beta